MASDGDSLTGQWFDGQQRFPEYARCAKYYRQLPVFGLAKRWLDVYFSGDVPDFLPPLRLEGSPFQLLVWQLLQQIPYGCLTTYGAIACEVERISGRRMSAQAVGGAVGRNPVSIIVPCHRVVGSSGALVGYAGGLERKAALLELESLNTKVG